MSLTVVKGMQSEIFVPITPPAVWTPVKKELKDMTIALAQQRVFTIKAMRDLILQVILLGEKSQIR